MLDILCVGDAVVDIFLQIPHDNPHFGLDTENKKLFIDLGFKINVDNYIKTNGGNSCNTAVGISKLGKNVGVAIEIGKDEFSNLIINNLTREKINLELATQDPSKQTSFAISINYKGERTLFIEHVVRPHNYDLEKISTKFIYLSSLGNEWEGAYKKTLDYIKKTGAKLAFNPGTLQIADKGDVVKQLYSVSDYLFLNKEEAGKVLYGTDTNLTGDQSDVKKLLYGLRSLGAKNVIVTDSKNGSYTQDVTNKSYHLGIINANTVESTGAGDSYNAGFLAAILNDLSIKDAMVWGALESASVVTKVGAQEGLLTNTEMADKLGLVGNFTPEEI